MPELEKKGVAELKAEAMSIRNKMRASKLKKALTSKIENDEDYPYHYDADCYDFSNVSVSDYRATNEGEDFIKSKGFKPITLNKGHSRAFNYNLRNSNSGKKTIGILFSGGLDSMYLMVKALETTDCDILPITFDFNNDWVLRNVNLDILREVYPNRILAEYEFGEFFVTEGMHIDNVGQQPTVHFLLGFMEKDTYYNLSEIQIGYVRGDTAASFQEELKGIYMNSVRTQKYNTERAVVPLSYPSIKLTKGEEMAYIHDWEFTHHSRLITVSCENPQFNYYKNEHDDLIITVEVCHNEAYLCHSCKVNHFLEDISLPGYAVYLPNENTHLYTGVLSGLDEIRGDKKKAVLHSFSSDADEIIDSDVEPEPVVAREETVNTEDDFIDAGYSDSDTEESSVECESDCIDSSGV